MNTIAAIIVILILLGSLTFLSKKGKANGSDNQTASVIVGCGLFLILVILLVLLLNKKRKLEPKNVSSYSRISSNEFLYACDGDYWIIEDDNIAVSKNPKVSANEAQFTRNLVTVLEDGTKVEILKSKDILSPWKYVYVYNTSNGQNKIYARGWILAETVKRATRIKKGSYCP